MWNAKFRTSRGSTKSLDSLSLASSLQRNTKSRMCAPARIVTSSAYWLPTPSPAGRGLPLCADAEGDQSGSNYGTQAEAHVADPLSPRPLPQPRGGPTTPAPAAQPAAPPVRGQRPSLTMAQLRAHPRSPHSSKQWLPQRPS